MASSLNIVFIDSAADNVHILSNHQLNFPPSIWKVQP